MVSGLVDFVRFVLFLTVVAGLPAFVIGTITKALLAACTRLAVFSRILVSGFVGLGFVYMMPAVVSEQLGVLTSGFVLITAVSFIVIGGCATSGSVRIS
jgi:hypothetical protein